MPSSAEAEGNTERGVERRTEGGAEGRGGIRKEGNKYINIATNSEIKNKEILEYIKSLHIPPGYKNVRIFNKNSKVLAYGYDNKDRKQTIYNKSFIEKQREKRFAKIMRLNTIFAKIQRHIKKYIQIKTLNNHGTHGTGTMKASLICLILQIMILCNFRIGCEKYARENKSYGLTTLEWSHIHFLQNGKIHIKFIGKKGVCNESILRDKASIHFLRKLAAEHQHNQYNINGKKDMRVFKYIDGEDRIHHINASDVNEYLQKFDKELTCKDIRTAMANYLYIKYHTEDAEGAGENGKKRQINAIKKVAEELHNTPTVCKKSYINPAILKF